MFKMPAPTLPSVFTQLGYEVICQRFGVYHLRRQATEGAPYFNGIGLLFIAEQQPRHAAEVCLFTVNACEPETGRPLPGVSVELMQRQWGDLDARRLLESGLDVVRIVRDADTFGRFAGERTIRRPGDAARARYVLEMESGDVVCLN